MAFGDFLSKLQNFAPEINQEDALTKFGKLASALQPIAAADTAYRNNEHMAKVMAANPQFGNQLYSNMSNLAQLDMMRSHQDQQDQDRMEARQRRGEITDLIRTPDFNPDAGGLEAIAAIDPENYLPLLFRKQLGIGGASTPAAIQIADEIQKARAAGDFERAALLESTAKIYDKGIYAAGDGSFEALRGYGDAVGSIEGAKSRYKTQAQKDIELDMDPRIERGVSDQRNESNLSYAGGIAERESLGRGRGTNQADKEGTILKEIEGNQKVLPIISELKAFNESSPDIAYSGKTQVFRRIWPGTSEAEAAVDLMRQARLDLAAPLAKQLGVNPTDKDFQASLDRIFDIEASKESRGKQIKALEDRIISRQRMLREENNQYNSLSSIPRLSVDDLEGDGMDALRSYNPTPTPTQQSSPIQITGDAEYNALPSGTLFIGPDGQTRRKP